MVEEIEKEAQEAGIVTEGIDDETENIEDLETTVDDESESSSASSSIAPSMMSEVDDDLSSVSSIDSINEESEDEDNFFALDIEGINESTSLRAQNFLLRLFEELRQTFHATPEQIYLKLESKKAIDKSFSDCSKHICSVNESQPSYDLMHWWLKQIKI